MFKCILLGVVFVFSLFVVMVQVMLIVEIIILGLMLYYIDIIFVVVLDSVGVVMM